MWINPQPLASGDSVVIGKFWNTTMSSPYYQYGLELTGGTVPNFLVGTTSGVREAAMTGQLPLNQWSYLAVVFDGTQVQFYVNGALVSTQALNATIVARGNPINIGADALPAQFYKGSLDDLRIYSRVLTQAQIQSGHDNARRRPDRRIPASLDSLSDQRRAGGRHRQCEGRRD
jgi:hypothetical protein